MKEFNNMLEIACPEITPYLKRIRWHKTLLLSLVISVITAFLCTNRSGGLNIYMGIAIPFFALYLFIFILSQAMLGSDTFAFSSVYLISLGITLQILISCKNNDDAVSSANDLCLYTVLGVILGFVATIVIYRMLKTNRKRLHIIVTVLTVLSYLFLFVFGVSAGGTTAWINVLGFSFQMTEITKIIAIAQISLLITDNSLSDKQRVLYPALIVIMNALFLVVLSELGTLIVIGLTYILISLVFLNKTSIKYLIGMLLIFLCVTGIIILACYICYKSSSDFGVFHTMGAVFEKILHRIKLFINPSELDFDSSYQVIQMKNALSVTEWFGSEIDVTVPVIESDLIVLQLISSFGLIAFIVTVIVQMVFFQSGITRLTRKCNSLSAIAVSFVSMITVSALLSSASSLCITPLVGLGYPFLAKGGTGLAINTAMVIFSLFAMIDFAPSKSITPATGGKLCKE